MCNIRKKSDTTDNWTTKSKNTDSWTCEETTTSTTTTQSTQTTASTATVVSEICKSKIQIKSYISRLAYFKRRLKISFHIIGSKTTFINFRF